MRSVSVCVCARLRWPRSEMYLGSVWAPLQSKIASVLTNRAEELSTHKPCKKRGATQGGGTGLRKEGKHTQTWRNSAGQVGEGYFTEQKKANSQWLYYDLEERELGLLYNSTNHPTGYLEKPTAWHAHNLYDMRNRIGIFLGGVGLLLSHYYTCRKVMHGVVRFSMLPH